jgi:glycosyltransferase involved in cell wall biosynthesis
MSRPRVSIGLAVYNGEEFLESSIESILAQTYTDFELIISDNASTDGTEAIGLRFAALDERVLYSRNPVNIGGVRNENRTMALARGEFFKLAAHDDLINPEYLERCVAELDRHVDADVCVPTARVIAGTGEDVPVPAPIAGLEADPADRMRAIADRRYTCEAIYGVFRTAAMRSVRPQANRIPSDYVVLCELAIRRPFVHAPEAMIWRRIHAGNRFRDPRARMVWFEPRLQLTGQIRLPFWRHLGDMAMMMLRVDVDPLTWCRCWFEVVGRVGWRYWRPLAKDVAVAAKMAVMGKSRRLARYRRAAGTAMTDPPPNRSVLVVAGDLVEESDRAAVCAEVDRLIGAGHMPSVLVSQDAADRFVDLLDALRVAGVPVQVCRSPTGFERRAGPLGEFAVTVAAVVDSGADSIHVLPGSEHLLPHLGIARRCLLRRISLDWVDARGDGGRGMSGTRARG